MGGKRYFCLQEAFLTGLTELHDGRTATGSALSPFRYHSLHYHQNTIPAPRYPRAALPTSRDKEQQRG